MEGPPYAAAGLRGALAVPLRPLAGVGGLQAPKLALDDTPEKVRPVFVFSQYAGDAEKGLQGRRLVVEIRDYWLATSGRSAHSSFAQKGSGETARLPRSLETAQRSQAMMRRKAIHKF
jgi:hypothetical protein